MKRSRRRNWVRAFLPMALILVLIMGLLAGAVWDEDLAVHIDPDSIENSTFIIGTHLIYIGALTNTLYEIAVQSGVESGQENVYYKSELAEGTWFDITTASTLVDITTGGLPVGSDVIAALFLTHHTKSDGITYDLRTNSAVNIFDVRSPYDLETMEELLPLKTEFDMALEMQSESEYGQLKIALLSEFFQTDVSNSVTQESDDSLAALQRYYDVLSANEADGAELDAVQSVMDAVDATRRAEVMSILDGALNRLAIVLQTVADTPGETDEDGEESEGEKGSGADPNVQSAVNDSLSNVLESYYTHSGKKMDPGVTVMSEARYEACVRLISDAGADNHAACDVDVRDIIALDNIQNGVVQDAAYELELLNSPLIAKATERYLAKLAEGENADYRDAVSRNAAGALKNGIIRKAASELSVFRSELEFFIDARCMRTDDLQSIAWVDSRLAQAEAYPDRTPTDGFFTMAGESIDAHIDFLTRLRRKLELALGGNDADKLQAQKAGLQQELLTALDNNDLAGAKAIEDEIAALDEQLAGLPEGNNEAGELASELGAEAKGLIADDGDKDDLMAAINALEGLLNSNYPAVFPVLEDLHAAMVRKRDLEDNTGFDDAIEAIEDILLDNQDAYAASMQTELTPEAAQAITDAFLDGGGTSDLFDGLSGAGDGGLDGLSDAEKAVIVILAYKMYGDETGDDSLNGLMRAKTQRQIELGDFLVFNAIQDTATRYLPAPSIAQYKKMRYVWNQNRNEATLARGGTYYFFTVYSTEVIIGRESDDVQYMPMPARYLAGVHLPNEYTLETFGLYAVYVPGTRYGILVSPELEALAAELFAQLLSAA